MKNFLLDYISNFRQNKVLWILIPFVMPIINDNIKLIISSY